MNLKSKTEAPIIYFSIIDTCTICQQPLALRWFKHKIVNLRSAEESHTTQYGRPYYILKSLCFSLQINCKNVPSACARVWYLNVGVFEFESFIHLEFCVAADILYGHVSIVIVTLNWLPFMEVILREKKNNIERRHTKKGWTRNSNKLLSVSKEENT